MGGRLANILIVLRRMFFFSFSFSSKCLLIYGVEDKKLECLILIGVHYDSACMLWNVTQAEYLFSLLSFFSLFFAFFELTVCCPDMWIWFNRVVYPLLSLTLCNREWLKESSLFTPVFFENVASSAEFLCAARNPLACRRGAAGFGLGRDGHRRAG